jgi:hypothetical protein
MNGTRAAGIGLSREKRAPYRTNAGKTKLTVLKVKGALKGVQLEASAPELDEREAGLRENYSPDFVHWRKMFQAIVALVSSRELATEMRIEFCGVEEQEGKGR